MKKEYLSKFYTEVCESLGENYKIILESGKNEIIEEDWIEYDNVKWIMDEQIERFTGLLINDNSLNIEQKILKLYEFICLNYIYDVNVLYFFKREVDSFNNLKIIAVDWYGRVVDDKWLKNRKKHNRRICYEFARFYAKAINQLSKRSDEIEAVMIGDKENLHYVVGITGSMYSVILDLDDFNGLKDLTRLKLGLTAEGIKILRDETGCFKNSIKELNKNKRIELEQVEQLKANMNDSNLIQYFKEIVKIIRSYNIDSQGFFEYVRGKIEKEGIEIEKFWKEDNWKVEKRYERCLSFKWNSKKYILDSVKKELHEIDLNEMKEGNFIFNPENNEYSYFGG